MKRRTAGPSYLSHSRTGANLAFIWALAFVAFCSFVLGALVGGGIL